MINFINVNYIDIYNNLITYIFLYKDSFFSYNFFNILNSSFETFNVRSFILYETNNFVFLISNSMISMFSSIIIIVLFFIYFFYVNGLFTFFLSFLKNVLITLYNIVTTYVTYNKNIFLLYISYVFLYIYINNFLGLIPLSNTINSHLNITGMISFFSWLGIIFIGFKNFGSRFISLFFVHGIPYTLVPFLASIEILSYIFRFISLSLRLFANIVAGHLLLETFYLLLFKLILVNNNQLFINLILFIIPFSFFVILILFEMVVIFLQAYIFIVLCLIYLRDSLYLH